MHATFAQYTFINVNKAHARTCTHNVHACIHTHTYMHAAFAQYTFINVNKNSCLFWTSGFRSIWQLLNLIDVTVLQRPYMSKNQLKDIIHSRDLVWNLKQNGRWNICLVHILQFVCNPCYLVQLFQCHYQIVDLWFAIKSLNYTIFYVVALCLWRKSWTIYNSNGNFQVSGNLQFL